MTWSKLMISGLGLIAAVGSPARADDRKEMAATSGYPSQQVDGVASGYYSGFPFQINYGLSGTLPAFGGYGYSGYGPGPQFGAHFPVRVSTSTRAQSPGSAKVQGLPTKPVAVPAARGKRPAGGATPVVRGRS